MELYCVRCKEKTPTEDITETTASNGTPMIQGICTVCGTKKTRLLPRKKK